MTETANSAATAEQKLGVISPAAAREFVKKATEAARERATSVHANAERATASVEQAVVNSVGEVAKLTRQAQQAAYEDAEAFLAGVDKLASAGCLGEAFQTYVDYLRGRGDVAVSRARATGDYIGKFLTDGSKAVQDNLAKASVFNRKAA
jgi:Phasin protein